MQIMANESYMDFNIISQLPSACAKAYNLALSIRLSIPKKLTKVAILASKSALCAEKILCDLVFEEASIPFIPIRGRSIPSYVAEDTLVIIFDAPNWNDEIQGILTECSRLKANVLLISHELIPHRKYRCGSNVKIFRLPENLITLLDSRYYFIPALAFLSNIKELNIAKIEFAETESAIAQIACFAAPDIPFEANQPSIIAEHVFGKVIFLYGISNLTASIAMRWKKQIQTAIGQLVTAYELPDIIVNEPSLPSPGLTLERQMVLLRDRNENSSICNKYQELVQANKDVIPQPIEIYGEGNSKLSRMSYLAYLGDFLTAYLGLKKKL